MIGSPILARSPTEKIVLAIAVSTGCMAVVQLSLGASATLVLALVGATLVSLVPVQIYRLSHVVGALYFLFCLYFGFNALLLPTLVLRPADANLFAPDFSAVIILLFACAASIGGLIPHFFFRKLGPIVRPVTSPLVMRRLAIIMFGLGLAGAAMTQSGALRAVANPLSGYLVLALVLEVAATLVQSKNRRSMSALGILIIAVLILSSFLNNSKVGLFITAGTWLVTNLAFGRRIGWRIILPIAVASVISTYFFFAINIVRSVRDQVAPFELMLMTFEMAIGLATGDAYSVAEMDKMANNIHVANLMQYSILYFDGLPVLAERFVLLPYADAILRAIPADGPFAGISFITSQFADLLPAFLHPGKQSSYVGNVMVQQLGLGSDDFNGSPTLGLAPELFYAGGYSFVALGTMAWFGTISALLAAVSGTVTRNVFAIYLIARYFHWLVTSTSMSFAFFATRQLPVDMLVFIVSVWFFAGRDRNAVQTAFGAASGSRL